MKLQYLRFFWMSLRRLFYPRVCVLCHLALVKSEKHLCVYCLKKLPKARLVDPTENAVFKVFRGRIPLGQAGAFLVFRSGGITRQLLHEIKYRDNRNLAVWMGEMYGEELLKSGIKPADCIIPVPLHRKKQKQRGYNQSEAFAQGLGAKMNIPVNTTALQRRTFTQTQTRKSRWDRWRNVEDVFFISNPEEIKGKSIMLVDDVVTTGATMEACARTLQLAGAQRIDIHSIAYAKD